MKFVELLQLLFSLFPSIISTVAQVEKAIPGRKKGAQKLAVVLSTVNAAAELATTLKEPAHKTRDGLRSVRAGKVTPQAVAQVTEGVTQIVNSTVAALNDAGTFGANKTRFGSESGSPE